MTDADKHSILLLYDNNYSRKKSYRTGPVKYLLIKLKANLNSGASISASLDYALVANSRLDLQGLAPKPRQLITLIKSLPLQV